MNIAIALSLLVCLSILLGACGDGPTAPSKPKKQPVPTERTDR